MAATPTHLRSALPQVSAQFSDAELAVNEQINSALQAPKMKLDAMTPSMASYAILREDLATRAAQNNELLKEQRLSFNLSARKELAERARINDEDAKSALAALNQIPGMMDSGKSMNQIQSDLLRQNPSLALNQHFISGIKPFGLMAEDEQTAFMRSNKDKLDRLQIGAQILDAEKAVRMGEVTKDNLPKLVKFYQQKLENEETLLDAAKVEADLKKLQTQVAFKTAMDNTDLLYRGAVKSLGGDPVDEATLDTWESFMGDVGLNVDTETFLTKSNPTREQMAFLTDEKAVLGMAGDLGIAPAELLEKLSVLGDPLVHSQAEDPTQPAKQESALRQLNEANRILRRGGGKFKRDYEKELLAKSTREQLVEKNTEYADWYSRTMGEIGKILQPDPDVEFGHDTGVTAVNEAAALLARIAKAEGIPLGRELDYNQKRALLTENGIPVGDTDSEIDQAGSKAGLWMDNSNKPQIIMDDGRMLQQGELNTAIRVWVEKRISQAFNPVLPAKAPVKKTSAVPTLDVGGSGSNPDVDYALGELAP